MSQYPLLITYYLKQRTDARATIQGALAYGITHPTVNLYFFTYIDFFSPTYFMSNE
jgi:hypothetical protein